MPKLKTHKGVAKRFRVTKNGKVKHRHSGTSHLAWRMTSKRVRALRGTRTVATCEEKRIIRALAMGGR
ncbi:MAG: 50S ribosomal protein L35 [Thermoguttaceae bacterium]